MSKWYIVYVTGEDTGMWPVELSDDEIKVVEKVLNGKHDGLFQDYAGNFDFEERNGKRVTFDTKEDAVNYIKEHLHYAHGYDEYCDDWDYDEKEEEDE